MVNTRHVVHKMIHICFVAIICLAYSDVTFVMAQGKLKPVTTHLNAKWKDTPLLLEASEYMNEENSLMFWAFVDACAHKDVFENYSKLNDKQKYDKLLDTARKFLSESQLDLLKLSLSMRVYSPKVETYRQLAIDRSIQQSMPDCIAVADVNGVLKCLPSEVLQFIDGSAESAKEIAATLAMDHHYPGSENAKIKVVLYSELGTNEFAAFHQIFKSYAERGIVDYVLRHYVARPSKRRVRLSGYGVELQIKSTEYKAQDDTKVQEEGQKEVPTEEQPVEVEGFVFTKLKSLHPDKAGELSQLQSHLSESQDEMAPLKVWQLQHLSMQVAQRVMSAPEEERLSLLVQTAQNFPHLARSLIRTKVDEKLKKEIVKNQKQLSQQTDITAGDSYLFINGMNFDVEYTDMFTLLDHIRTEQRVMEGLHKLGLSGDDLTKLLSLDVTEGKTEYGIDIRDSAITWFNDIETDKAYLKWPSSTSELLRPSYPGMLRSVRKNIHNLVLVVDPSKAASVDLLKIADSFVTHTMPVRVGVVLSVNTDIMATGMDDSGVALLCAFNYVVRNGKSNPAFLGLQFLIDFYAKVTSDPTVEEVTSFFKKRYRSVDLEEVFGEDSDYDVGRTLARDFLEKAGLKNLPQALMNGIPVPEKHLNGDEFEEVVLMEVMRTTQAVQKAIFKGDLDDRHDMVDWLMALPNIMPRLNNRILSNKLSSYIDMSEKSTVALSSLTVREFEALRPSDMTAAVANSCRYLATKNDIVLRPLTAWVVADFDSVSGQSLLWESLKYSRESNSARFCFVHNPTSASRGVGSSFFSKVVEVAHATLMPAVARQFLSKVFDPTARKKLSPDNPNWADIEVTGMDMSAFTSRMSGFDDKVFKMHSVYSNKVLSIAAGKQTVVVNGRILGAFEVSEKFLSEDYGLLEKYVTTTYTEKISDVLKTADMPGDVSDTLMRVTAVLQTKPQTKSRIVLSLKSDAHSVIKIPAHHPDRPAFDIVAVVDPVSLAAQRIGPILVVLMEVVNANIRVVLNSKEKHSEMPLKSFYRYVLEPEPQFTEDGELSPGPLARFIGLPETPILTQNYHVPENWLVEVVKSVHDLDNIKLETVESGVHSEFELEHLLLEGHCFEQSSGNPPRGLQFTLGTRSRPVMVDTTVMANLGYFQLKANPGAWLLKLRQGKSAEIYSIASHEGTDTPSGAGEEVQVVMSSFRSNVVKVRVAKLPGMQGVDLLGEDSEDLSGIWDSITSFASKGTEEEEDKVNIFSVASGHLYERFLRIMMLSVRKNTKKPVKFWFLKNFLSPSLKDSLPILADEYGFEYELVQYKWPRWLHQQTEKQRIIWGYKILFLDVLFPLDVKKIIFVDADQVVRSDMNELNNLNLDGAPYGFVPFCDSRKEMEGFRFWKQGYWRNHLSGRKYHISALFVVDLKKFRRIAAGDRLRGQYQGLSQDPNSLSNLDQDLPNNMVHQVRIKSLPQEWLWCETWCDDASKGEAKVIDLCNNPLTKEAKLEAAQRIISEWTDYDNDIKNVLIQNSSKLKEAKHGHESSQVHSEL